MDTVINILTNHNMVVIFVTLLQLLEFRGKGWVEGSEKTTSGEDCALGVQIHIDLRLVL